MDALIAHFTHPKVQTLKHPLSKPRVVCFEGTIISHARYLNELAAYRKRRELTLSNMTTRWGALVVPKNNPPSGQNKRKQA